MATKSEKRRIFIYINGKEVEDNLRSLTSSSRKLRNELAGLTPGTDKFIKKSKELRKVNGRVKSIKKEINGLGGAFGSMKKAIGSNLFAMVGWGAAISGAVSIVRGAYKVISDFDESVADLAKTTNLSKEAARELAQEVIKIDTRTSVTSLLELATAAGRLGLKGKDIVDFTKSADITFVALGDSLEGSAEDIALTMGKIAGNFNLDEKYGISDAILRIGSVLNDLGAKTKATEGPIIDFTQRLAGVAGQANVSLPDIAALGATFDETGQSMEIASSVMSALFISIGKDVERFAGIAGVSVKDFKELLEKDAIGALKLVAEGAKSNKKGFEGLSDVMDNYGISGKRAASILGVLSSETELLTENQKIANNAIIENTSTINEFALKMGTLNAKTDKFGANYDKMILSLEDGSGVFSQAISAVVDYGNSMVQMITTFNNASGAYEKFIEIGKRATVDMGIWSEEQASYNSNIAKQKDMLDVLREKVEEGTLSQEKYALAVKMVGEGWDNTKEKAVESTDVIIEKTQEELAAEKTAQEEKERTRQESATKTSEKKIKERENLQSKIDELKNQAVLDGMTKDEAEVEQIRQKYAKLIEERVGYDEQIKELELLRDEELAIKEAEQEEKQSEKDAKFLEEKQALQDELELIRLEDIDKELSEVDAKYEALYAKADKFGLDTTILQKVHAKEQLAIHKKYNDEQQKDTEESQKAEREAREKVVESFGQILGQLSQLAKEGSIEQKALALGEIGVDTALAISALTASSESNPANAVSFGAAGIAQFASGMVRILANIMSAKKLLSSNGKAKGGYTGDGFGMPDETGYKVAGYVHQNEWVAPEWMTSDPMYADTIGMLESARKSKTGYAIGGPVTTTGDITTVPDVVSSSTAGLEAAINTLNQHLANGIKAETVIDQNNLISLQEGLDEINQIN